LSIEIYQSLGLHTIRLWGVKEGLCECGRNPCGNNNRSAGKHPIASGWQRQPLPDLYFPPPANVGLRMGQQPGGFACVALDVDDSLAFGALSNSLPKLPPTLTTFSGNGYHLLFKVPAEILPRLSNFVKRGGIDLRAAGGQVVAAPSLHYSGKRYSLNYAPIETLPELWIAWLLESCAARPARVAAEETCPYPRDLTWLKEAIETVKLSPFDYPGSPGLTWRLAVKLVRGWLLPSDLALQLLRAWNAGSLSPLPDEKLVDKIRGAETGSDLAWGFARPLQGGGSLNQAQSPAELVARPGPPNPEAQALPSQAPDFAPQPIINKALTQEWLEQRASGRGALKQTFRRLADGDAYRDLDEFRTALQALAQGSPVNVHWTPESVVEKLGRCWVGDPINLGEIWRSLLEQRQACDLTHQGIARVLATHPAWQGSLAYDVLADRLVVRGNLPFTRQAGDQWTDHDFVGAIRWFGREFGSEPEKGKLRDATVEFAHNFCAFNPLTDYLDALAWDGQPRLDGWLVRAFGAQPTQFVRDAGTKWLLSCLARAYQPGCQADYILTLQGVREGEGKNQAFEILALKPAWYGILGGDLSGKEAKELLRGKWLVVLDELAALRRSEKEAMKSFATLRWDTYRPSYGFVTKDYPRRCVLAATTNERQFLSQDPERRFWPVAVGQLDRTWLIDNRDQIWAEALVRFRRGEDWWQMDRALLGQAQAPFKVPEALDDRVSCWMRARTQRDFTINDAAAGVATTERLDERLQGRIAKALYRLGCKRLGPVTEDGVTTDRWVLPEA
jgi:hypothetical protein